MPQVLLGYLITPLNRVWFYLITLLSVFFVDTYCTTVCQFIDGIDQFSLYQNLGALMVFQLVLREFLWWRFSTPWSSVPLARQGYYLSIISWLVTGVAALVLHGIRYPDFPVGSHLKLLSSYWLLGAGILAQLEYVILERTRERIGSAELAEAPTARDSLAIKMLEGYFIFTLVPTVAMIIVVLRYCHEGLLPGKVSDEVVFIGLIAIVGAIVVAIMQGRMLSRATQHIVDEVKKIEKGDFVTSLPVSRQDELGAISQGIVDMAEGLRMREVIRNAFGKFVDPSVANRFIEEYANSDRDVELGGERRELVILMCDIRDFTPLVEKLPPADTVNLLNRYFERMVEAIQQHGGVVDKFIGDAIMGVFGLAEDETPQQAANNAVSAARAIRAGLAALNEHLQAEGLPLIENGIGIHAGEVIAGYIGSKERLEFTVIGSAVNVAARIEAQARDPLPAILYSSMVNELLDEQPGVFVNEMALKGVSVPVRLYTS